MNSYTDAEIEVIFRSWWSASFPGAPPGPHAIRTHVAFGQCLLERQGRQQQEASHDA